MTHLYFALACLALLAVVAVQDYLVPALRQETISSGLTGHYHVALDAAFVVLAVALIFAFRGHGVSSILADGSAVFLVLTGFTGTATVHIPQGERWHTICTAITFVLAIALQFLSNGHNYALWVLTLGGTLFPIATHFLVPNPSVTEKVGVTQLCLWLIAWSLS
jgi:hypothetical protein